ncbi:MAG: hypothetical protein ACOCTK_03340 [Candidatus Saliniplasma sp.]
MSGLKEPEELVEEYTRKELNHIARKVGIDSPSSFKNKLSLAKEIVRVKKAKKYAKKPIGLYIED